MEDFNMDLFFDELEIGKSWKIDSNSLTNKKKEIKQEFNDSKDKALDRKVTALLSNLKSIEGSTMDPKQWLSLPHPVQSMYTIGKSGKFITILN